MDVTEELPTRTRTGPERAMARALVLARRGMGSVRPNPPVGAVLVKDGVVVGEGYHAAHGGDHAEVVALDAAGERARGADLYVSLEPCNHSGMTPPCVPRILEAGVASVRYAIRDPNPGSGRGARALAQAGLDVSAGPGTREARRLVAGFASLVERKRPRFILKVAVSLDGRIAAGGGDSRWISSGPARAWVHRRRREADAIVIGAGTALRDNPALTTRHVRGRSPDRIVLDSRLRVPETARVWAEGARRVVATTEAAPAGRREALAAGGVEVWVLPAGGAGRVDPTAFAQRMGTEGYTNVLVEGGGELAGALLRDNLVDEIRMIMSRRLLLGNGRGWTDGLEVPAVARAVRVARSEVRALGPDWLFTLVPESAQWWDPGADDV